MLACSFPGANWRKRFFNLKAARDELIDLVLVGVYIHFEIPRLEWRSTEFREDFLHLGLRFTGIRTLWAVDFYLDKLAQVGHIIQADDDRTICVNASVFVDPYQFLQCIALQEFLENAVHIQAKFSLNAGGRLVGRRCFIKFDLQETPFTQAKKDHLGMAQKSKICGIVIEVEAFSRTQKAHACELLPNFFLH